LPAWIPAAVGILMILVAAGAIWVDYRDRHPKLAKLANQPKQSKHPKPS
jgi:hypothetical protein